MIIGQMTDAMLHTTRSYSLVIRKDNQGAISVRVHDGKIRMIVSLPNSECIVDMPMQSAELLSRALEIQAGRLEGKEVRPRG